ncbi:(deoxy)nucleoside triphosphate pyrophosphohydrolase [Halalkalibacter akibai]|uniref:8-oxo-dGTP diphosphatase n=1 Tax=Halalkalibacter akibai (strain ATCC 43226 / DSM 21942 / CIP 109018 / JCM 9157 / 1139) TaxID=1236973 RepID=W4QY85_HALA3|nr:(deoxy)nucleoside triphosphate pyrophosphohydrolase [Halalkalibacter akibai]GAE36613.1 mutator MutT protein [Halalkalibacter akibai JCM 9157]
MKEVTVVGAVIKNKHNQILCAQRASHMVLADYWEFPGGKVESGEDFQEALIREIEEELACTISIEAKITETTYDYDFARVHLHTYWCSLVDRDPIAKEHAELRWLSVDSLVDLNWAPADLPTIEIITN